MNRAHRKPTRIKNRLIELRIWMAQRDMNQRELALASRISATTISQVFSGLMDFTFEQAGRLAQMTGLPLKVFITGGKAQKIYKISVEQQNESSDIAKDNINVA